MLKVSIITVSFNSIETIKNTIESVKNQDWPFIEHIIIDGASNDGTLAVIENEINPNMTVVSEPDNGIYDAMNKGIALASGDIIGFLNSDDFFANESTVRWIASSFDEYSDICYGDLVYVERYNVSKYIRYWKSGFFSKRLFKIGWIPPHPTFYARASYFSRYGNFNLNYNLASDFELMHRFIIFSNGRIKYLQKTLVYMRLGGATNESFRNIILQNQEILKILKIKFNFVRVVIYIVYKLYRKFLEFTSVKILMRH